MMVLHAQIPVPPFSITLSLADMYRPDETWMPASYRVRLALRRATRAVQDQTGLDEDAATFVACVAIVCSTGDGLTVVS